VLPDGVRIGTSIPFGRTWRGYTRFSHGDFNYGWRKQVRTKGARVTVDVLTTRGKATEILLFSGWGRPCAS
jgi:hypothetical protein